ncbi:DUF4254 domain-containing protein [Nocardia wallacei]|uniref:DUF4254 domain-containing protein n=1 Tax=Nocardia wallacei TaxID=480035 RepID=A0A7G1KV02_9NOCA|nr:DUF4254 domain-containing protein [Nocardia wallacei]BCK58902.1 hypothetical protein NWFMUON74_66740 [Nocardia wallacei]
MPRCRIADAGTGESKLPGKDLLLAAMRGMPHRSHPVLEAAAELAILHRCRAHSPGSPGDDEIDRQRAELVLAIDRFVLFVTPVPPGGAPLHTETIGTIVDRLAWHCTDAHITHADDEHAHGMAVLLLHKLADAYDELSEEVARGRRRLPSTFRP